MGPLEPRKDPISYPRCPMNVYFIFGTLNHVCTNEKFDSMYGWYGSNAQNMWKIAFSSYFWWFLRSLETANLDPLEYGFVQDNEYLVPATSWRILETSWSTVCNCNKCAMQGQVVLAIQKWLNAVCFASVTKQMLLTAEIHTTLRSGRQGAHGLTWVMRLDSGHGLIEWWTGGLTEDNIIGVILKCWHSFLCMQ